MALLVIAQRSDAYGQDNSNNVELFKTVPPAPNAAALAQYGNIPVSLATGIPQISIPLYNIEAGAEFSMPLSLSYHAAGIKADQRATFAGLGWTLNGGGAITRVIKGNPDEYGYSGPNRHGEKIPTTSMNAANYQYYQGSALGSFDSQPDEFFYNFNGVSGRFVVGVDKEIYLLPYRNIKIEWIAADPTFYFRITTEDGTKYVFTEEELTTFTPCAGEVDTYVSAWYLKSVTLPKSKQVVTFEYVQDPFLSVEKYSETRKSSAQPCGGQPAVSVRGCLSTSGTSQLKIRKISFPGGVADFTYSFARTDLTNSQNQQFYALSTVDITTSGAAFVKRYSMEYGYLSGRLSLSAVNDITPANGKVLTHKLSYSAEGLPGFNSKAQDHWGYYNGANNTLLVPGELGLSGADREPNQQYAKAGLLEKIEYPSGGTTTFEFESNNYGWDNMGPVDFPVMQTVSDLISIRTGHPNNPNYRIDSIVFTQGHNGLIQLEIILEAHSGNFARASIRRHSTGQEQNLSEGNTLLYLVADTYTVIGEAEHAEPTATAERVTINLQYQQEINRVKTRLAGGVRVRKITSYDGLDHSRDIVKSYAYASGEQGRSSGYLLARPNYTYAYTQSTLTSNCTQTITTSAANNEIEYASGGIAVYSRVQESQGTTGQNGTVHYYYEIPNQLASIGFPFTPAVFVEGNDALLRSKQTFDKDGVLQEEISNDYTKISQDTLMGWKAGFSRRYFQAEMPDDIRRMENVFSTSRYRYISSIILPAKERRRLFIPGGLVMADSTMYFYDNHQHILPTRIWKSTSDGRETWVYKKYVPDFALPATGTLPAPLEAIRFMQQEHWHAPVVEQYAQQVRQSVTTTLSGQLITYKKIPAVSGFNALLDSVYSLDAAIPLPDFSPASVNEGYLKKDTRYSPALTFHVYDNKGNIQQQAKADDVNEVILWGYNSRYPVAKVSGSNYNTVAALISQNILDSPADENQLRTELGKIRTGLAQTTAEVFTYTYKPLVGMSSATDAKNNTIYYEYDDLGRLKTIRDKDNRIIKMICYDVKGQVYDCGGRSAQ